MHWEAGLSRPPRNSNTGGQFLHGEKTYGRRPIRSRSGRRLAAAAGELYFTGGEVVTREKTYGTDTLGDGLSSTRPRRRTNKQTNRWTRPWRKASAFTTDGDLGPIAPTILIFK